MQARQLAGLEHASCSTSPVSHTPGESQRVNSSALDVHIKTRWAEGKEATAACCSLKSPCSGRRIWLSSLVACSVPKFVYSELHSCAGKSPEQPLLCKPDASKPVTALAAQHAFLQSLIIKTREPAVPYTIFLPPADGGVGGCTDNPIGCTFTAGLPSEWMTGATAMSAGVTLTPSGLRMHRPGFSFQVVASLFCNRVSFVT